MSDTDVEKEDYKAKILDILHKELSKCVTEDTRKVIEHEINTELETFCDKFEQTLKNATIDDFMPRRGSKTLLEDLKKLPAEIEKFYEDYLKMIEDKKKSTKMTDEKMSNDDKLRLKYEQKLINETTEDLMNEKIRILALFETKPQVIHKKYDHLPKYYDVIIFDIISAAYIREYKEKLPLEAYQYAYFDTVLSNIYRRDTQILSAIFCKKSFLKSQQIPIYNEDDDYDSQTSVVSTAKSDSVNCFPEMATKTMLDKVEFMYRNLFSRDFGIYSILMTPKQSRSFSETAELHSFMGMLGKRKQIYFVDLDNFPKFYDGLKVDIENPENKAFLWMFLVIKRKVPKDIEYGEINIDKKYIRLTRSTTTGKVATDNAMKIAVSFLHERLNYTKEFYIVSSDEGFTSYVEEFRRTARTFKLIVPQHKKRESVDS